MKQQYKKLNRLNFNPDKRLMILSIGKYIILIEKVYLFCNFIVGCKKNFYIFRKINIRWPTIDSNMLQIKPNEIEHQDTYRKKELSIFQKEASQNSSSIISIIQFFFNANNQRISVQSTKKMFFQNGKSCDAVICQIRYPGRKDTRS